MPNLLTLLTILSTSTIALAQTYSIKPIQGSWGTGGQRNTPLAAGEKVPRQNHDYPLSDQGNTLQWRKLPTFSDEFDGEKLNLERWLPHNHILGGRPPAMFLPENVEVRDGHLHLYIREKPGLEEEIFGLKFKDWSSATCQSLYAVRYGYFEVRAKPGIGSSAFWLYAQTIKDRQDYKLELDVYELGGRRPHWNQFYNMNSWVFRQKGLSRATPTHDGVQDGGKWNSGINFAENFHVFGFHWGPELITWYVDGIKVREMRNRDFHSPLYVLLDTETMPDWFGLPTGEEQKHAHEIDYIRAWTNDSLDQGFANYAMMVPLPHRNPTAKYLQKYSKKEQQN